MNVLPAVFILFIFAILSFKGASSENDDDHAVVVDHFNVGKGTVIMSGETLSSIEFSKEIYFKEHSNMLKFNCSSEPKELANIFCTQKFNKDLLAGHVCYSCIVHLISRYAGYALKWLHE